MKLEKAIVKIKGQDVTFLKPTVVELINIEDECFDANGNIDKIKYDKAILGLVNASYRVEDFVKRVDEKIELSTKETFSLPEISYEEWMVRLKALPKINRVALTKLALGLSGVSGEITLEGFTYEDITNIGYAFLTMYDDSELNEVVDAIASTCFPKASE